MNRKFFSLALTVLFVYSIPIHAGEAVVWGTVTDPQNAVVSRATVHLASEDGEYRRTVGSGKDGTYRFARLTAGEYLIKAEAAGFADTIRRIKVVSGETRQEDLRLELGTLSEDIVVVAAASAQPLHETAKSVTVIDRDHIESRNEFEVSQLLRAAPSMRIAQLGGPGAFTTVHTRGLRTQDTAFLIDGVRFRDASAIDGDATSLLEDLIVVGLDRVEILRGPGSYLYGTNAIAGTVNLLTDRGGWPNRGTLQFEGGGLGLFRARGTYSGGSRDGSFAFSAGASHVNVSGGLDGDDAYRNTGAQGTVAWTPAPGLSLSGRVLFSDNFLQLNDDGFAAPVENLPPSGVIRAVPLPENQLRRFEQGLDFSFGDATFVPGVNDPDQHRAGRLFAGLLRLDHQANAFFSYSFSYSFTGSGRQFRDGPGGQIFEPPAPTSSDFDGRIHLLQGRADLRLSPNNLLTLGYEFERQRSIGTDESVGVFAHTRVTEDSHSFFVQDQIRLLEDRLHLAVGARAQAFGLDQPQFQGGSSPYTDISRFDSPPTAYTADGSIAYLFPTAGTKLQAHVGNAYRAPSLFNRLGTTFFIGSFSAFGDPRLRSERSIGFDAGIEQAFAAEKARLGVTYFYTRLQETIIFDFTGLIDPTTDPFGRFGGYANSDGGLSRGLEVVLDAAPLSRLRLSASYTFTNSDQARGVAGTGFSRSLGISDHIFTLNTNFRLTNRWEAHFDLYAASDNLLRLFVPTGNRDFLFDGPIKADLGGSYLIPLSDDTRLRIYAKVDNLFDHRYFEGAFPTAGITGTGGFAVEFH